MRKALIKLVTILGVLFLTVPAIASERECFSREAFETRINNNYVFRFGELPTISTVDEATARAFDEVYSKEKNVDPEKELTGLVVFSNGTYVTLAFMKGNCSNTFSQVLQKDFIRWMEMIKS